MAPGHREAHHSLRQTQLPPTGSLHRQWEVIPNLKLLKIPSLKHEIHRNSSTLTLSRWCCPAYRLPSWLRMRLSYRFDIDSIYFDIDYVSYTGSIKKKVYPAKWDIMRYHDESWTCPAYNSIFSVSDSRRKSFLRRQSFTRWTELSWAAPWRPGLLLPRLCYWRIRWVSNGSSMGEQWVNNGLTMGIQWVNNG